MTSIRKMISAIAIAVIAASLFGGGPVGSPLEKSGDARNADSRPASSYTYSATVIGCAGSPGTSTQYSTNGTMGQPTPIGAGTAAGTTLLAGYWGHSRVTSGIEETPAAFRLFQNHPNPFNPVTTITFSLANECRIDLTIFDVGGRRIRRLVRETRAAGLHRARWDGTNDRGAAVATGLYFYRLEAGPYVSVKKMVLLK